MPKRQVKCLVCYQHKGRSRRTCSWCLKARACPGCKPQRCWVQEMEACKDCVVNKFVELGLAEETSELILAFLQQDLKNWYGIFVMLTISYDEALVNMNIPNLEIPLRKHHSAETSHCEGPGHRTASNPLVLSGIVFCFASLAWRHLYINMVCPPQLEPPSHTCVCLS